LIPSLVVELCHPHAQLPSKKRTGDAGYDLYTPVDVIIDPNSQMVVPLGIKTEFPDYWVALVKDRSSVALRGCHVVAGVVDSSYRGEWKLVLWNLSDEPIGFLTGEKIAQFVLTPIINNLQPKQGKVSESDRGSGGFGSSGR